MSTVRERVGADLKAGRLWKARERLVGLLRVDPANQWALDQLGEIYFRMGDLPQAGRAWYLTPRVGPEWEAAETAFYERYGKTPSNVVAALHVRAAIDQFPPEVQVRLRTLQRRLEMEGRFWEPKDRPPAAPSPTSLRGRIGAAASALIVALILVALGVGLVNIVLYLIHVFSL
jgi:tetratricopeptide (TPR) repeat protein